MKLPPSPPSNHDPGPWKEVSRENGLRIVEAPTYSAFFEFVNLGFGDMDGSFIWRGQRRAEWEIKSTLAREGRQTFGHLEEFRDAVARSAATEFDISDKNPDSKQEKLRLWSLGQHHGLVTPLIDWTVYPYVALFFAFAEMDEEFQGHRAVFALDWHEVAHVNFHILETDGVKPFREKLNSPPYSEEFKSYLYDNFGFRNEAGQRALNASQFSAETRDKLCKSEAERCRERKLHIYSPGTNENRRIHNQGGRHVYTPEDCSVDEWVKKNKRTQIPLLIKVLIPNSERANVLRCLNKMNINYLTLFPDVEGAAKHSNLALRERR